MSSSSEVKVAFATNQAEAELIQNILEEEGIPSMLKRSPGFDVPDFLAAGPRDVFVPPEARERALELLRETGHVPEETAPSGSAPWIVLASLVGGIAIIVIIAILLTS